MLLLLAILIFVFILFYCLNYINNKNFNTVEVVGEIKKEKTQKELSLRRCLKLLTSVLLLTSQNGTCLKCPLSLHPLKALGDRIHPKLS